MFKNWKSSVCRVLVATIAAGSLTLSAGCDEKLAEKAAQTMRAEPTLIRAIELVRAPELATESELKW